MTQTYFEYTPSGGSATRIYIEAEEIREVLENELIVVTKPISGEAKQNATDPVTRAKDIKRIKHVIFVRGYISQQTAVIDGVSTSISTIQAKNYLLDKILWRGISTNHQVKFYYRGGIMSGDSKNTGNVDPSTRYENVFIRKVEFRDSAARLPIKFNDYEDVQRYEVQIEMIRATPL